MSAAQISPDIKQLLLLQKKSDAGKTGEFCSYTREDRQHGGFVTGTVTSCWALGLIDSVEFAGGQPDPTRTEIQVLVEQEKKKKENCWIAALG